MDSRLSRAQRDIKPANILLADEATGYARLTDVGIARHMDAGSTHVTTGMMGTMGYVSYSHLCVGMT
jgi:serine/threonine protein kinase